jgi:hypothetical protein
VDSPDKASSEAWHKRCVSSGGIVMTESSILRAWLLALRGPRAQGRCVRRVPSLVIVAVYLSQLLACGGADNASATPPPPQCPAQNAIRNNAACDVPSDLRCLLPLPSPPCSDTLCVCSMGQWSCSGAGDCPNPTEGAPQPPSGQLPPCPPPDALVANAECPSSSEGQWCEGNTRVCGGVLVNEWFVCEFAPGLSAQTTWQVGTAACGDAGSDADGSGALGDSSASGEAGTGD